MIILPLATLKRRAEGAGDSRHASSIRAGWFEHFWRRPVQLGSINLLSLR